MSEQSEYAYDLFVSYAEADRAWVEGYLLDALTQAGVRCYSEAAFALGVPRLLEFERAVQHSQRTLLILSPAYLAEGFSQFTDLLAQSYGLETATWPVIPLILQPVELPPRLAMLTALAATDSDDWPAVVERLCTELQQPVPGPAPKPPCPYPGMVPFSEANSARFFGRDREVQELLERLRLHPFLTVIGPSGSGKSSLVFAGLVPALRRSGLFGPGEWLIRSLRPGETPMATLAATVAGDLADPAWTAPQVLTSQPEAHRLLLVVDQFEELFTLARADVEPFQQALLRLAEAPDCYLILTVRADFYADLMASPLWREIQAHRVEVLPLDGDGLRQAIVRPAEDVGVFVETALVERLVADAADEPGTLPFTQETLVLLWDKVERRYLPLRAYNALILSARSYRALGGAQLTGLQVAMARRADAALTGLTPQQQIVARRIFMRLVQFGEGRADTRRQQPAAALRAADDDTRMFEQTLLHLAAHRLLTLGGEEESAQRTVDIAHEALIGGWPTLQEWLGERREAEQVRRRLEAKAAEWERLGRGSGGLLDEVELLEAERWLVSPDAADLGLGEALPALAQASREAQKEAAAQQRRAARFRLGAIGAIAALIIAVLVTVAVGLSQVAQERENAAATAQADAAEQQRLAQAEAEARYTAVAEAHHRETEVVVRRTAQASAQENERLAITREAQALDAQATAEAERDRAEQQARLARSGQLATDAQAVYERYPQRNLLLAAEALSITMGAGDPRVPAAEDVLRQALANSGGRSLIGHERAIIVVAISPDGHWLVTASSDKTARLWDLSAPDPATEPIVLTGHDGPIWDIAISPDNHWLATGGGFHDKIARLWDLTAVDPAAEPIVLRGHEDSINDVAFSPDNHWLVTGSDDYTAHLWDLTAPDPAAAPIVLRGHENRINAIAISPDNRWLVTGSDDNTARLWDLTAPDPSAEPTVLRGHEWDIAAVAVSPDGRWLVTGSWDRTARLWDLTRPAVEPIILRGHGDWISSVAISPDSRWLVTGSHDATARLWDLSAGDPSTAPIVLAGHRWGIAAVAFSPDGRWLVTTGYWDPSTYSWDNTARLWDLTAPDPAATPIVLRSHEGHIFDVAFSPDGRWLVTGSDDHAARLWDLTSLIADPIVLRDHEGDVGAVTVSPDNRWLVTSSSNTARLWDLTDLNITPTILRGVSTPVAFSPDGRWLVTGSNDGTICLWDLAVADPAAAPTVLTGHDGSIHAVAVSPDSRWLVAGSDDHTAHLWDLTSLTTEPVVLRGHEGDVRAVIISPDGRWLVTGSEDSTARLWDLMAPDPSAASIALRDHGGWVYAVAISPDSHWLVTSSSNTARLWDLTAADPAVAPIELRGHELFIRTIAISSDNHWLVTGSDDGTARLWDLTAPDPANASLVLRGHKDTITAVAISPDSHWLVTGSGDRTARLWDLTASNPAVTPVVLRGHEDWINAVVISPDGHWLVTGSDDNTARVWNLRLDELVDLACRTAGRNLTREEWEQYFPGQEYRKTCEQWPKEGE